MDLQASNTELFRQLQKEILSLQGFRSASDSPRLHTGLGAIEKAFPGQTFPTGAIHEFISNTPEASGATSGFLAALVGRFMQGGGTCLWIGTRLTIFPSALKAFGIAPERIIFVDLPTAKNALWALEEALKCEALTAVVGELKELDFTQSRRLQLAVEQSHVTGFIHRHQPKAENVVACVTRWKITPLPSAPEEGLPGVGLPRWQVQLLKSRNGTPGTWQIEWAADGFQHIPAYKLSLSKTAIQQTG